MANHKALDPVYISIVQNKKKRHACPIFKIATMYTLSFQRHLYNVVMNNIFSRCRVPMPTFHIINLIITEALPKKSNHNVTGPSAHLLRMDNVVLILDK